MKKNIHDARKTEHAVIGSILMCLATFFLTYTFFFQYPQVISKRALLLAGAVGGFSGSVSFFLSRLIHSRTSTSDQRKWKITSLCLSLLITCLIAIMVRIPENYLFAPQISVVVEVPAAVEGGGETALSYIHTGLAFVSFDDIDLAQNTTVKNGNIYLTPQHDSPAQIRWQGRAWERVEFGFATYEAGSQVIFEIDGKNDIFFFDKNEQVNEATTSIKVPGFWFHASLSHISTLGSLAFSLYAVIYFLLCLTGNFLIALVKKVYASTTKGIVIISRWEKGKALASGLLWAGNIFFSLWLLHYAYILLVNPNPAEYREGANLLMTEYLLQGKNPFALENQPLLNTNKGFLYNYVVLPFAAVFGNSLFIHRLVSLVFILLSCYLIFRALKKACLPTNYALASSNLLLAPLLFYVSPIARVDGLGTFLFLAAVLSPWMHDFDKKSLILSGALAILAFFTKPYFILSAGIVAAYLFLFNSKKRGLLYGILTLLALLLASVLVRAAFECYFLHTIFNSFSNASDSDSFAWMVEQVTEFIKLFLPLGMIFLILYISRRENKKGRGEKQKIASKSVVDIVDFNQPFLRKKLDFFFFFFLIGTLSIVLLLGKNHGNYMVYLFQLMAPSLILWIFSSLHSDLRLGILYVPLILINLALLCFGLLYPNNPEPYESAWDTLNAYVESSEKIFNSPLLVAKMLEEGMTPVDSGSSEYYYSTNAYPDNFFAPAYSSVEQQGAAYLDEIQEQVEQQSYDRIMITENYSPFCKVEVIEQYYDMIDRVEVYLPQSNQSWVIQIWVPNPQ